MQLQYLGSSCPLKTEDNSLISQAPGYTAAIPSRVVSVTIVSHTSSYWYRVILVVPYFQPPFVPDLVTFKPWITTVTMMKKQNLNNFIFIYLLDHVGIFMCACFFFCRWSKMHKNGFWINWYEQSCGLRIIYIWNVVLINLPSHPFA